MVWLGLAYGVPLCVFMAALIGVSLWHDPMIWIGDAPEDVQAAAGPPSAETIRRKWAYGALMTIGLIAIFGHLARAVAEAGGGFFDTALAVYVCFQVFNLFDALLIDVPLVLFAPSWAFPPGIAVSPSLRDPRWHLANFAKGVAGGLFFALLVAVVSGLAFLLSGQGSGP